MNIPGFAAARALVRGGHHHAAFRDENGRDPSTVVAAEFGGPGNVPPGYNLECKLVAVPHCDLRGCWTEYQEYCTLTPIRYRVARRNES